MATCLMLQNARSEAPVAAENNGFVVMGNDLLPLEHFGISVCICADALYFYKYKYT